MTNVEPHLALELLEGWFDQLPTLWWRLLVLTSHLSQIVSDLVFDDKVSVQFTMSFT